MRWIYLSHPLAPDAPVYGGGQGFFAQPVNNMAGGDSCNTSHWQLSNHMGTHLDFSRHFVADGKTLENYSSDFFIFEKVHLVRLNAISAGRVIGPDDVDFVNASESTTLLLLKTGFETHRGQALYWQQSPGFHPEMAEYIRFHLPNLRVVGFDTISLSSFVHRDIGRKAHRAFLDHHQPILLLEDMALGGVDENTHINQVVVAPLRVTGADGSPCTVMAQIGEKRIREK
jgi:kynurenine formamidase